MVRALLILAVALALGAAFWMIAAFFGFYIATGFEAIEELHGVWKENACLLMLKAI